MTDTGIALPLVGTLTEPNTVLTFTFDGRTIEAVAGQSIAAALYAAGLRIFTRSFKYHRPRGLFCVAGDCPNCLMNVDGRPNVRTCIEPARRQPVLKNVGRFACCQITAHRTTSKDARLRKCAR